MPPRALPSPAVAFAVLRKGSARSRRPPKRQSALGAPGSPGLLPAACGCRLSAVHPRAASRLTSSSDAQGVRRMVAFTGDGAQTARREARRLQQQLEDVGRLGDDQLQAQLPGLKQACPPSGACAAVQRVCERARQARRLPAPGTWQRWLTGPHTGAVQGCHLGRQQGAAHGHGDQPAEARAGRPEGEPGALCACASSCDPPPAGRGRGAVQAAAAAAADVATSAAVEGGAARRVQPGAAGAGRTPVCCRRAAGGGGGQALCGPAAAGGHGRQGLPGGLERRAGGPPGAAGPLRHRRPGRAPARACPVANAGRPGAEANGRAQARRRRWCTPACPRT